MNHLYKSINYAGILDNTNNCYKKESVITNRYKTLVNTRKEEYFRKSIIHSNDFQNGINLIEDYINDTNNNINLIANPNKLNESNFCLIKENELIKTNKNVTINTRVISRYRDLILKIKEKHNVLDNIDLVVFDPDKLTELLSPGDIIFKYCSENSNGINGFNFITYSIRHNQFVFQSRK